MKSPWLAGVDPITAQFQRNEEFGAVHKRDAKTKHGIFTSCQDKREDFGSFSREWWDFDMGDYGEYLCAESTPVAQSL